MCRNAARLCWKTKEKKSSLIHQILIGLYVKENWFTNITTTLKNKQILWSKINLPAAYISQVYNDQKAMKTLVAR
jgi:hypothetical protein